MRSSGPENGVEFLEAWFQASAYRKHRHDTYAIGLTTKGIQSFDYRGAHEVSMPGEVMVLHPDELHDGHAGTEAGYSYRMLYVEPALIFEAVTVLCGHPSPLPFVRAPVVTNRRLSAAITSAFQSDGDALEIDSVVLQLAQGLLEADPRSRRTSVSPEAATPRRLDVAALEKARGFLDAERNRVVRSTELEAVTGLTRYDLARQFRLVYGTSPYRYLIMRRLDDARRLIAEGRPLVDVALETGFADQAHFTRMFRAAYGLTPASYAALHVQDARRSGGRSVSLGSRRGVRSNGNADERARLVTDPRGHAGR